jgi:hypothetical protein
MPEKTKIFLASSSELAEDREKFEIFISRENNRLVDKGIYLELVIWKNFLDVMSQSRLQDEYNKAIKDCDIFVMLYHTKVGKYTAEEFETAFGQFKATNRPLIFTYFKTSKISLDDVPMDDILSLKSFQEKLKELGHFQTKCKTYSDLLFHFKNQLEKLQDKNFFQSQEEEIEQSPPINNPLEKRLGMHHAYTCDRVVQYGQFSTFLDEYDLNSKCHFFYIHGDKKQSPNGLFERFVAKLKGVERLARIDDKNENYGVTEKNIFFPAPQDLKYLQIELIDELQSEFNIPEKDKKKLRPKNLAKLLDNSYLKNKDSDHQVCIKISIPSECWHPVLTPKVTKWFIEEFCCQKIETEEIKNSDRKPEEKEELFAQKRVTQKRLFTGPEFFFFFCVDFKKEDKNKRDEINKSLKEAEYTIPFDELQQIEFDDITIWFTRMSNKYIEAWKNDQAKMNIVKQRYFPLSKSMDMEDVQKSLSELIKRINNPIEKNEFRNTKRD